MSVYITLNLPKNEENMNNQFLKHILTSAMFVSALAFHFYVEATFCSLTFTTRQKLSSGKQTLGSTKSTVTDENIDYF